MEILSLLLQLLSNCARNLVGKPQSLIATKHLEVFGLPGTRRVVARGNALERHGHPEGQGFRTQILKLVRKFGIAIPAWTQNGPPTKLSRQERAATVFLIGSAMPIDKKA